MKDATTSLIESAEAWAQIGRNCLLCATKAVECSKPVSAQDYRKQSDEAFENEFRLRSLISFQDNPKEVVNV